MTPRNTCCAAPVPWVTKMGEIAEGILEGLLCQTCGVFLDEAVPNHPRWCDGCRPEGVQHVLDLMGALKKSLERVPVGDGGEVLAAITAVHRKVKPDDDTKEPLIQLAHILAVVVGTDGLREKVGRFIKAIGKRRSIDSLSVTG